MKRESSLEEGVRHKQEQVDSNKRRQLRQGYVPKQKVEPEPELESESEPEFDSDLDS